MLRQSNCTGICIYFYHMCNPLLKVRGTSNSHKILYMTASIRYMWQHDKPDHLITTDKYRTPVPTCQLIEAVDEVLLKS